MACRVGLWKAFTLEVLAVDYEKVPNGRGPHTFQAPTVLRIHPPR
jgi:hypothetical protein